MLNGFTVLNIIFALLSCLQMKFAITYTLIFNTNAVNLIKDIHNSWLYCFTNPLELGTRVSLSHRQPNVYTFGSLITNAVLNNYIRL